MKKKFEYLLLAAIILAAVAYLMFRETDQTRYDLPTLPEVSASAITHMEIARGDQHVSLKKAGDQWHVFPGNFPADAEKAAALVDAAAQLFLTARVSESENYARYDLGDEKKIRVKALSGDTVSRAFDVGSTASTFRHAHVKIDGDPNVYQAQGNLRSKFEVAVSDLRDKTVLSFDATRVRKFSVTHDGTSIHLVKKPGLNAPAEATEETPSAEDTAAGWTTQDGKPVDEVKLKRLLTTLSTLKCQEYINDRKKDDFASPEIEILIQEDKTHRLSLFPPGKKDSKNRPGVSSDNGYPFLLANHQIRDITSFIDPLTHPESSE